MVTSSAAWERQDLRLGWLCASVFLHVSVIFVVAEVRSSLPRVEPVTPTLLVGTSFEVLVDEVELLPAAQPPPPAAQPPAPPAPPPIPAKPDQAPVVPPEVQAAQAERPALPSPTQPKTASPERAVEGPSNKPAAPASPRSTEPAVASPDASPAPSQVGSTDYGQEGKEGAPAQLRRAFIKMLPLAAKLDPSWLSLPAMSLGRGRFVLRLNEQGQLTSVEVRSGDAHPALVRAMQKNRAFLGIRRFAAASSPGERSVVVEVSGKVSQKAAQANAEDKVIALGVRVDPQDPQAEPRGAYFTYGNGQHVEILWTVVQGP